MRKILITNDDGIEADGIVRLARAAALLGEVYVIAPNNQCSAMSHRITLREEIDVFPVDFPVEGVRAYATTGTPADCVRFGVPVVLKEKPDVVLSGINFGYNCGTDIQYSATVGAALEAASNGIHAIALSEGMFENHEVTDAYLSELLEKHMEQKLGYNQIWNINFPGCSLSDYKGIMENRSIAENAFYIDRYQEEPLEKEGIRLRVDGVYHEDAAPGTDFRAIVDGYISIGIVNNLKS